MGVQPIKILFRRLLGFNPEPYDPELYQEVQDKHDECLSSAALSHHGYIFATQGDAFELVFPTIGDAVRFCLEAQVALLRNNWSAEALALPGCGKQAAGPRCSRDELPHNHSSFFALN